MGMLRAVTMAFLATWGAVTASADGPPPGGRPDPYVYTPYEAAPGFFDFNWSGIYVGGHLGGSHTNVEATESVLVLPVDPPVFDILTYGQDAASFIGGVQAGWQKQWEKIVAGIELTYTALSFDESAVSPLEPDLTRSAEVRDLVTLTGRLGYADGRWLAYAKGGWASAQVDIAYHDTVAGVVVSSSGRESGWTAGVGIDYALWHNLFLGIEYNYLHFNADVPQAPIPDVQSGDAEVDIQSLVVRLNYRFGGPCCSPGR